MDTDRDLPDLQKLNDDYEANPSLEKYLAIRRQYPTLRIATARFGGLDPLFSLQGELTGFGLEPLLVCGALDGNADDADELVLQLMERLVLRQKLEKAGKTHLQSRGGAIPDTLINYLIVILLEACEVHQTVPSSSLIVLIRERLGGAHPARHQQYLLDQKKKTAVWLAAQMFDRDERISIRQLAKQLHVEPSTITRWYSTEELEKKVEDVRKIIADLKQTGQWPND